MAEEAQNKQLQQKIKSIGVIGGQTIFAIAFLLIALAAIDKLELGVDWSLSGNHSLHPATERIASQVKQTTHIFAVWPQNPDDGTREAYLLRHQRSVKEKLKRISNQSALVQFDHIDPRLDKPRLSELEKTYGSFHAANIYVCAQNGRQITIPYSIHFEQELESSIASALLAIEETDSVQLSILTGHGELDPGQIDLDNSLNSFVRSCEKNGVNCSIINPAKLSQLGRIPQNSILCIAGATAALGADTIQHIDTFLRAGGNALILADYRCPPDLSTLLRFKGVMLGSGITKAEDIFKHEAPYRQPMIVCSADQSLQLQDGRYDRLNLFNQDLNQAHPVSARSFNSGRSMLLPYAGLMSPMYPAQFQQVIPDFTQQMTNVGTNPYQIEQLLRIQGKLWPSTIERIKVFPDKINDSQGHVPLALAIRYQLGNEAVVKDKESRMVIVGSRQFAADRILSQSKYANDLFLLDAIQWLSFRQQQSEIPPTSYKSLQVDCSESTLNMIGYGLILFLPLLCLALVILTWWDRR